MEKIEVMGLLDVYELKGEGERERERERSQIIEIIARSRKPIYPFEIKDSVDKTWFYENQFLRGKDNNNSIEMTKESVSEQTIR
jgi:hypothetical protein